MTHRDQVGAGQPTRGWSSARPASGGRRFGRRLGAFVLLLPLIVGVLGAPTAPQVARGDELSDAKARQAQLKKDIEAQKAQIDKLNQLIEAGPFEVHVARTFALEQAADAHRALEEHYLGKLALHPR